MSIQAVEDEKSPRAGGRGWKRAQESQVWGIQKRNKRIEDIEAEVSAPEMGDQTKDTKNS